MIQKGRKYAKDLEQNILADLYINTMPTPTFVRWCFRLTSANQTHSDIFIPEHSLEWSVMQLPSWYMNAGTTWLTFFRQLFQVHFLEKQGNLNRRFFSPCDLEICWMTQKNNRTPLLCYFKLFASFRSHWWIQTGVTVRKRLIWVKIDAFFRRVTLKFEGWPSKTIGHLFYATSSFVQHFVATGEFKLELQSGNAQSGSNSTLYRAVWPWNLTDDLQKQ